MPQCSSREILSIKRLSRCLAAFLDLYVTFIAAYEMRREAGGLGKNLFLTYNCGIDHEKAVKVTNIILKTRGVV